MIDWPVLAISVDWLGGIWAALKVLPQAVMAWAAWIAATSWQKQIRETGKIEVARQALVLAGKIREHLNTLRELNSRRRVGVIAMQEMNKREEESKKNIDAVLRIVSPEDGGQVMQTNIAEAAELVHQLRAWSLNGGADALSEIKTLAETFAAQTQTARAPGLFSTSPVLEPDHWGSLVAVAPGEQVRTPGGELVGTTVPKQDDTTHRLQALLESLQESLSPIVTRGS